MREWKTENGGITVWNEIPIFFSFFWPNSSSSEIQGGLTGVTVVSDHPTSTTNPVILPQATRLVKLDDENETDGTCTALSASSMTKILRLRYLIYLEILK